MLGRPITPRTFEFSTANTVWLISHGLGAFPIVDVYVTINGEINKIMPAGVQYIDPNTCVISFSVPRSGTAVLS